MSTAPGLHTLSRSQGTAVPPPASRWRTRIALPALILLSVAALLGYAARDTLRPAVGVRVAPVVARPAEASTAAAMPTAVASIAVQAPGWIEPAPYPVSVAALAEGVVESVHFLEGQRLKAGDVMVEMVSVDASLNVARIRAELDSLAANIERAKAQVNVEKGLLAEVEDEERRTAQSAAGSAATESELIRVRARLSSQQAAVNAAQAAVDVAIADHARCLVMCDEADLNLKRMTIKAPVDGVVLSRLVEPGTRVSLSDSSGDPATMGVVARLYDPASLQVRVEVPLADAAKLRDDMPAELETEGAPNHIYHGRVVRIVNEANIQRNTIQAKVLITDPTPALKPEMLARVRLMAATEPGAPSAGGLDLMVPQSALTDAADNAASVWLIDQRTSTVSRRAITLTGARIDDHVQVASGLSPGDRIVVDPTPALREGTRVRVQEGR